MDGDIEPGLRRVGNPQEAGRTLQDDVPAKNGNPDLCSKCQALLSFQITEYVTSQDLFTRKLKTKERLKATKGNGCSLCATLLHSMGSTVRQELNTKQSKDLEFEHRLFKGYPVPTLEVRVIEDDREELLDTDRLIAFVRLFPKTGMKTDHYNFELHKLTNIMF